MGLLQLFLLLLAILLSTFIQLNSASTYSQCNKDEQSLLLQLKQSLQFDPNKSTKLEQWNSSTNCCEWLGVTCNTGGFIIGIDLSFESIVGGINNSNTLFDLQYLESLNFAFNRINGTQIPSRIDKLTNLRHLNMSFAGFRGQIPVEISSLTRLVNLDLSGTNYRGLKLENPNLRRLVQNLTHLVELRLDGVNISANGEEWCLVLSSALPNLQVLSLSYCSLSGPIHPSLAKLQSLSVIQLNWNNFSAPVPDFLANFLNLTTLSLRYCQLVGTFPDNIFLLPELETINLSDNKLLLGSFPEPHQYLPPLQTVVLSRTSFSGSLPQSIGNLRNLSRMELAGCNFSGPIPSSMANLTRLVYLDLSLNMFTGPIPPLHLYKNLTYINFSNNKLTGDVSSTHWEILQNLIYVNMNENSFTGKIPLSLLAIPLLQKLSLSSNQLVGKIPELTNALSSSLDALDLSNNRLDGSIPSSLFDLKRLGRLSLSFNKFNDSIGLDKFWRLGNLTHLVLSYSNLSINTSGSYSNFTSSPLLVTLKLASCNLKVFPDLRGQSQLIDLDLSDNQIDGVVPNWIWNVSQGSLPLTFLNLASNRLVGLQQPFSFPKLSVLDLHDNQLQGHIPPLPPSASYVDYSSNKFNSTIPKNIGDFLSNAYFFSLSDNRLSGVLPQSLCTATKLAVLDLSNNYLNGTIPACVIRGSEHLGVLNLGRNKFEGNVVDIFPSACKLQTLDLSGNLLVGKVPKSLVNCAVLEVLDLGNNQIQDAFPCLLENISTLRVLVLQSNKFYGVISCSQERGIWQRLQIVNLASNNFRGLLPMKLLTSLGASRRHGNEPIDHLRFNIFAPFLYYQDSITITTKGLEMEFVKILTVFTTIDLSSNRFEGHIPETVGQFTALLGLNLSHNALTGPIPSSLGNLSQLESLDLSSNQLHGPIPGQFASLTFLGFLNVSYNRLVGKIPTGTQLQTFSAASFEGNDGLCGPPLSACFIPESPTFPSPSNSGSKIDWIPIAAQLGFTFGLGIIIMPLMFSRRWRIKYYTHVDGALYRIFPQLEERSRNYRRKSRINRRH